MALLTDLATGQTTRCVDLGNIMSGKGRGGIDPASCSCSPRKVTVECRHIRALRAVNIFPNPTRTEGED